MAAISIPNAFSAQTKIESAKVNANFTEVSTKYNAHDTATTGVHGVGTGTLLYTSMAATITNNWIFSNNVGIGTTPSFAFHISKSVAGDAVAKIRNESATGYGIVIKNGLDTQYTLAIENALGDAQTVTLYGNGKSYFAGNMGIGVTPGTYPITVKSAGGDVVSWQYNDGTEKGRLGIVTDSGVHGWLGLYNSSGVENLRLAGNGKITLTTASGVAPIILPTAYASGANVTNLSADMVDGNHASAFSAVAHDHTTESKVSTGGITGVLGTWTGSSFDTVYAATTDLLVTAYGYKASAACAITGYTDGSNPPLTIRLISSGSSGYVSITMPVRKGDNWKVTITTGYTTADIFAIPIGS